MSGTANFRQAIGRQGLTNGRGDADEDPRRREAGSVASMLIAACPAGAAPFAVAMHETCCSRHDDDQTSLWLLVVEHLRERQSGQAAADMPTAA